MACNVVGSVLRGKVHQYEGVLVTLLHKQPTEVIRVVFF